MSRLHTLWSIPFCFALAAQEPQSAPATPAAPAAAPKSAPFRLLQTFAVGGDGSWDYIAVDPAARRLYASHGDRVEVLDATTGKKVGEIADTKGVHGIAVLPDGRGITTNGRADTCTVFDLASLKAVQTVKTGKNPDALVYEPTTKCVFVGDGRSHDVSVVDAAKGEVVATIELGGKPEALVVDGKGKVYVNVEDTSEIAELDAAKHTVLRRFTVAPGEEPSGLAIDVAQKHLFAVCANRTMVVVDIDTGKVLATPPIGGGVDGAAFDAEDDVVLSSNGEGSLTVVSAGGEKPFAVLATVPTGVGARTLVYDAGTQRVYLPTAEFEAPAAGERGRPRRKPDSFRVLVVGH